MTHIRTESGFEIDIDESVLDDIELFDAIVELDEGKQTAIPKIISKLIGKEKKRLYDAYRLPDGRVPMTNVSTAIAEIIRGLSSKKS